MKSSTKLGLLLLPLIPLGVVGMVEVARAIAPPTSPSIAECAAPLPTPEPVREHEHRFAEPIVRPPPPPAPPPPVAPDMAPVA